MPKSPSSTLGDIGLSIIELIVLVLVDRLIALTPLPVLSVLFIGSLFSSTGVMCSGIRLFASVLARLL